MVSAWAPTHATLIFSVPVKRKNHLEMGSTGIGINFETGVLTTLTANTEDEVFYNNKKIQGQTSLEVINIFRKEISSFPPLKIEHESKAPIGFGLSTSGGGAIGVALALNKYLSQSLTFTQCLQIAHRAEIIHRTGLGSVSGQSVSGIEIREKIGAPGIGKVQSFYYDTDIIILLFAPLSTSRVLLSNNRMKKITEIGNTTLSSLLVKFTLSELFEKAREFTFTSEIATKKIKEILNSLEQIGETLSSMAMIGETIVVVPKKKETLFQWCKQNKIKYISTKISTKRPHIMD